VEEEEWGEERGRVLLGVGRCLGELMRFSPAGRAAWISRSYTTTLVIIFNCNNFTRAIGGGLPY
jgi:hypothetical protein